MPNIVHIYIRDYVEDSLYQISLKGNIIVGVIRFNGHSDLKGVEMDFGDIPERVQESLGEYDDIPIS